MKIRMWTYDSLLDKLSKPATKPCVLDYQNGSSTLLARNGWVLVFTEAKFNAQEVTLLVSNPLVLVFQVESTRCAVQIWLLPRDPCQLVNGVFCKTRQPLWTPSFRLFIFRGPLVITPSLNLIDICIYCSMYQGYLGLQLKLCTPAFVMDCCIVHNHVLCS